MLNINVNYFKVIKIRCQICGNDNNNEVFKIREMMFGMGDYFDYLECSECGCLQLIDIPPNIEKYYSPDNYYSLKYESNNFLMKIIRKKRDEYAIFKKNFIGKLIFKKYPYYDLEIFGKALCQSNMIDLNSRILDVGSGNGYLIKSLKNAGFSNITGIEPFINEKIIIDGLKILKKAIKDIPDNQEYDLIMFNHSLEHLTNHLEVLVKVSKLLSRNGVCFIRMPVKNDYIWKLYGENWVQIDAPRHFLIHTLKSFDFLVKKTNLKVLKIMFDSNEFQFWGSEQYKRDIPLESKKSYGINPKKSIFTKHQIKKYKKRSEELNGKNLGDQAFFILEGKG